MSTVFALSTVDGKVHVYDLSISQYNPLCVQAVVNRLCVKAAFNLLLGCIVFRKKSSLTHLAFNVEQPILLVGDNLGVTHCLKLSPNLRSR